MLRGERHVVTENSRDVAYRRAPLGRSTMARISSISVLVAAAAGSVIPAVASPTPAARKPAPIAVPSVGATIETPALLDDDAGGHANGDDPAIWVHPSQPAASLVIVTKKNAGLSVYDLAGQELQAIAPPAAPVPTTARVVSTTSIFSAASTSVAVASISRS
jgi:myo-inositol-hexaphosphate 3-phosphohydrolase